MTILHVIAISLLIPMWLGLIYVLVIEPIRVYRRTQFRVESPFAELFREWEAAKARTYARQGITPR